MRTPSRDCPPLLAMLNMEPMAATAKTPFMKPSAKTEGLSGQPGPTCAAATRPESARAEPTQPSTVQLLRLIRRGNSVDSPPTSTMPSSTPEFWMPDSDVDWPGVSPKTMPAKGSRIRSCAL